MKALVIALAASAALPQAEVPSRAVEGDWFVSDDTDNNTGERKVYALNTFVGDSEFVMITMSCKGSYPRLVIQWDNATFADQAVFTIQPGGASQNAGAGANYVFEKVIEETERGMEASKAASSQIVASLGNAESATITAHLPSSNRLVSMNVGGTQQAWARVVRHCPVKAGPVPPL